MTISKNKRQLIQKIKADIVESNCNYGEVADVLVDLKNHYALKAKSLANAANIHEVNKFCGIKQYDD